MSTLDDAFRAGERAARYFRAAGSAASAVQGAMRGRRSRNYSRVRYMRVRPPRYAATHFKEVSISNINVLAGSLYFRDLTDIAAGSAIYERTGRLVRPVSFHITFVTLGTAVNTLLIGRIGLAQGRTERLADTMLTSSFPDERINPVTSRVLKQTWFNSGPQNSNLTNHGRWHYYKKWPANTKPILYTDGTGISCIRNIAFFCIFANNQKIYATYRFTWRDE